MPVRYKKVCFEAIKIDAMIIMTEELNCKKKRTVIVLHLTTFKDTCNVLTTKSSTKMNDGLESKI